MPRPQDRILVPLRGSSQNFRRAPQSFLYGFPPGGPLLRSPLNKRVLCRPRWYTNCSDCKKSDSNNKTDTYLKTKKKEKLKSVTGDEIHEKKLNLHNTCIMFLHEHHRRRKRGWFRWVSHIYSFAVCVTNFVAASFHLKEQEWLDMFRQFVWVVERVILFCRCYKFYLSMLLSVQVSLVKMPPKRTIESFYCFIKAKLSTY